MPISLWSRLDNCPSISHGKINLRSLENQNFSNHSSLRAIVTSFQPRDYAIRTKKSTFESPLSLFEPQYAVDGQRVRYPYSKTWSRETPKTKTYFRAKTLPYRLRLPHLSQKWTSARHSLAEGNRPLFRPSTRGYCKSILRRHRSNEYNANEKLCLRFPRLVSFAALSIPMDTFQYTQSPRPSRSKSH